MPATLQAFDPATQTAKIQIDVLPVLIDPRTGGELPQKPLSVVVPVLVHGDGKADGYLSFPLLPGNTGALHVFDRDIQAWLTRAATRPVIPRTRALHQLHDAYFEPGLTDNAHRIPTPIDLTAVVLHHSTGIKLGRAATLGVARTTDAVSPTAAMAAWALVVETFVNGVVPGLFTPANSFAGTVLSSFATITGGSVKVKAE